MLKITRVNSQYAHDVVLTSMRRRFNVMDVVWTSKRRRVRTGLEYQFHLYQILALNSGSSFFDECENSEISFKKKIVNPWKRTVVLNSKKPCGFETWFSYYIDLYTSH